MRMRVHDTGLGFICAHMSSGEAEGDDEKRNHDHHEILRRAQFPQDNDVDAEAFTSAGIAAVNQACYCLLCLPCALPHVRGGSGAHRGIAGTS